MILSVQNLSINFDQFEILKDVSFDVSEGQVLSVVGESGVGKTTLLKAIAGLQSLDSGEICFEGNVIDDPKDRLVPGVEGVSTIFQDYQLMHNRTVEENVAYPLRALVDEEKQNIVNRLLDVVQMTSHRDHFPNELSGGQKQRIALARALAEQPDLLLMDEPFSHLDPALRQIIKSRVLAYIKDESISAILVTHDPQDALSVSDQIVVLEAGRIVQEGSPQEIYEQPISPYVMSCFGHTNYLKKDDFSMSYGGELPSSNFEIVGIRIEDIRISQLRKGALKGLVIDGIYQGSNYLIKVKLTSGNTLYFNNDHPLGKMEHILLTVSQDRVQFFNSSNLSSMYR